MRPHVAPSRLPSIGLAVAALLAGGPSHAAEPAWRAVTEAGVTFQPGDTPLDRHDKPTHLRWTGVLGAVRRVARGDALGPVFLGAYSENDYTAGAGVRWEHRLDGDWTLLVAPGYAIQDRVDRDSRALRGYFAEMGLSFRRAVTVVARVEGIRYRPVSFFEDPPGPKVTENVVRFDARVGRAPGTAVLGCAAAVLVGVGIAQATGPR